MERRVGRFDVSRRKLCRILRFLEKRKIPVRITYFWTNSIGMNVRRSYGGVIKNFEIITRDIGWYYEYCIKVEFYDGSKMEEDINSFWQFDPYNTQKQKKCKLVFYNSGPECSFIIERKDP